VSDAEVDVVLQALRHEAGTWDEQGEVLAAVAATVESTQLSALQAGVFVVMRDAYSDAVEHVASRCREGSAEMTEIAAALRANATAYERRDEEVSSHVGGAY